MAPWGGEFPAEALAELQAEMRALREQLTKMEQWVFAVDVSVTDLDAEVTRRFQGMES
jgi:hypothetical protein